MAKDADSNVVAGEDEVPAAHRKLAELADEIERVPSDDLSVLADMLLRADRPEHAQLLEEVEIRARLRAHMGRDAVGFLVLVGTGVLVATIMRAGFLASRPFLGFGLLGALLLLLGLRGWYRAKEVRERLLLIEAHAAVDEEYEAAKSDASRGRQRTRRRMK